MVLFGFVSAFSMILLPSVTDRKLSCNRECFSINYEDTAWYVSSIYISQILGSFILTCGYKAFGRKPVLMLVNAPMIIAWVILGISWSKDVLLTTTIVLGLSIGYLEGNVSHYISQISQPHLRKALTSFSGVFRAFGAFLVSGLRLFVAWKAAAVIGVFLHVLVAIVISLLPETPDLLSTDGKLGRAEKTLYWIIGCAQPCQELNEVSVVAKETGGEAVSPEKSQDDGNSIFRDLKLLNNAKMLKCLGLMAVLLFISNFSGTVASEPFVYMLSKDYNIPMADFISVFVFNVLSFVASVLCMLTSYRLRKKVVVLISVVVATLSTGMLFFWNSWIAFFGYSMLVIASRYGLEGNLWSVLDDVFSQEGRVLAFRIATSLDYFYNYIAVSTYARLRKFFGIQYLFLLYTLLNICGFLFIYIVILKKEEIPVDETLSNEKKEDKI